MRWWSRFLQSERHVGDNGRLAGTHKIDSAAVCWVGPVYPGFMQYFLLAGDLLFRGLLWTFWGAVCGGCFSLNWRKCVHASAQGDLSPLRHYTSKTLVTSQFSDCCCCLLIQMFILVVFFNKSLFSLTDGNCMSSPLEAACSWKLQVVVMRWS